MQVAPALVDAHGHMTANEIHQTSTTAKHDGETFVRAVEGRCLGWSGVFAVLVVSRTVTRPNGVGGRGKGALSSLPNLRPRLGVQ